MTFEERFTAFYPILDKMAKQFARTTPIPKEEYESLFAETFYKQYEVYDPKRISGNFTSFMRTVLTQEGVRMATRKERRYYDSITYIDVPDDADEEALYPLELVADVDIEEQVFDELFVEEELDKADGVTRDILAMFFEDPHVSYREIGRKLGVEDKLVKRRLESVAKAVSKT